MNKIQRVSKFFRILFQIAFIAIPLLQIAFWINAPASLKFLGDCIHLDMIPPITILHPLSNTAKFLGFCINMIPTGIYLYILYSLIKLFRLYEKGEIFSMKIVNYFKNVGYALLIGELVNPFYQALISVLLSWNNNLHGEKRYIGIALDGTNVGLILTGLFVILISWIMAEGCKLREEQQLTI